MKKLSYLIILAFLVSCTSPVVEELNGNWVINSVVNNGKEEYPKTNYDQIQLSLNFSDPELSEKIHFKSNTNTAILPGFNGKNTECLFDLHIDTLIFYTKKNDSEKHNVPKSDSLDKQSLESDSIASSIFHKKFIISPSDYGVIILKSKTSEIKMISEKLLISKKLNNILK